MNDLRFCVQHHWAPCDCGPLRIELDMPEGFDPMPNPPTLSPGWRARAADWTPDMGGKEGGK